MARDLAINTEPSTAPNSLRGIDLNPLSVGTDGSINRAVSGAIDQAGGDVGTIMERYAQRRQAIETGGQAEQELITKRYGRAIQDEQSGGVRNLEGVTEAGSGFVQQTAMLRNIAKDTREAVRDLEQAREEALLMGRVENAKRFDQLIADELEAVSNARKRYTDLLFRGSEENRAQSRELREQNQQVMDLLSFETPEEKREAEFQYTTQQSIQDLAINAPDAGILPGDDLGTAISKYRNSRTFMLDRETAEKELELLNAQIAKAYRDSNPGSTANVYSLPDGTMVAIDDSDLTAAEKNGLKSINNAATVIDQIERAYTAAVGNEYEGFGSGVAARLKGLGRTVTDLTGTNQEFTTYKKLVESNLTLIAKGMKGEAGNLSDQDIKRARDSFPSRFNSPQEAQAAFDALRELLRSNLSNYGQVIVEGKSQSQQENELDQMFKESVNEANPMNTSTPRML